MSAVAELIFLFGLILDDFVEVLLPDKILTAVIRVIPVPAGEVLYVVAQILNEFAVPVYIGNVVPILMMVSDASPRVGKHVRHERHAATVPV